MAPRSTSQRTAPELHAPHPLPDPVMAVRRLTKIYGSGDMAVRALDEINVDIERGRFTAIMGPSGSGKSTFMHCLAGFESITSGSVRLDDVEIAGMSQRALTKLRRNRVGFIFQSFNLIPTLSAAENIRLPQDIAHAKVDEDRFAAVVDALNLRDRLSHRPAELSGGQQQRVACARALMQNPTVLFADEPTGNLDSRSTEQVLSYLRRAVDDFGQTVVMVTHEAQAAAYADTVLFLTDGRVVAQLDDPSQGDVLDALAALDPHAGEERA
ncbi:ABC transporter ATP-binding protein [Nanchangia anserum]|uniref:ABC transporter ATP-binding protein n=1 Tax=Nanchangia anserum TaxID=2692125 RepID=A0A8I0G9B1_9ACTO|nr:ABC transporter ATP-binding protein [Nanchangia anserum]MBD3689534.1 ABC transporter ATP-binding protein [Nanchangia anserum]QOX81725.1 ABC transporter ATP-binding protein [Nanchangia anserum]